MSTLLLADEVADDLERIAEHLRQFDPGSVRERLTMIRDTLQILARSPLIGRPTALRNRELVIGRGARGYVALYTYFAEDDIVLVLAIRGQREAGYP